MDYKDRVLKEVQDLGVKVHKLNDFIKSDEFKVIEPIDQMLLIQQYSYMYSYFNILEVRIERF